MGISNQNVEPLPSSLSTPISPFIFDTISLLICKPSPVPCAKELSFTKR